MEMETWDSQSAPGKQVLLSVVCLVLGLALMTAAHRSGVMGGGNARAGFMLGALLVAIGGWMLLASTRQNIVIDPTARRISVEDENCLGKKLREIRFDEVAEVQLGYLGKRSNFVTYYYLTLKLHSGENYPLFSPGRFYPGSSDRATVAGWRRRLEGYLWP